MKLQRGDEGGQPWEPVGGQTPRRFTNSVFSFAIVLPGPTQPTLLAQHMAAGDAPGKKMSALVAPPSLGRKRPSKADSATRSRIAALHNLDGRSFVNKEAFHTALQHSRIRWTMKGPLGSKRPPTETASLGSRNVRTPPSRRGVVVSRSIAVNDLDPHGVRRPSPLPRLVLEKRTYRGPDCRVFPTGTIGLPALRPIRIGFSPQANEIRVEYETHAAVSMASDRLGALLVAYCVRTRIPIFRQAYKDIRIEAGSVFLTFATHFTAVPATC